MRLGDDSKERLVAGLMSGTSADGVDVALVKVEGGRDGAGITVVAHDTLRYTPAVRERILACQGGSAGSNREATILDAYLGELFAHAVLHICKKAGLPPESLYAVGSHGQTLYHHPDPERLPGFSVAGTLQIGSPAVIAERTGATVVSGFRGRDRAAGGQGAPLVAYMDYVLFHHRSRGRIVLNVGGLANLTSIPAGASLDRVAAFDTGPGNCLIDGAVSRFTQGQRSYDADGAWALSGKVRDELLKGLMEHPYLAKAPPKSADKEAFGAAFLDRFLASAADLSPQDAVATLTAFTVQSVASAVKEFIAQKERFEELIVSGGGARNPAILRGLETALPKLMVSPSDDYGVPGKAKEAVLMAFLAAETLAGHAGNVPSATGAARPVVLGSITPGSTFFEEP